MLRQWPCLDGCGPHAWCLECQASLCPHVWELLAAPDVRAAIRALPPWSDPQPALGLTRAFLGALPTIGPWRPAPVLTAEMVATLSPASTWRRLVVLGLC